jgi:uncharacterized ferritin-like protein (DUF455 family)
MLDTAIVSEALTGLESPVTVHKTGRFYVFHELTLFQAALKAFIENDGMKKYQLTKYYTKQWNEGRITKVFDLNDLTIVIPLVPGRPTSQYSGYQFSENSVIPLEIRTKLKNLMRKNGVEYTIHGIANAELYAVDLFWDLILRYIQVTKDFPKEFFNDIITIVEQEANHFLDWKNRVEELGYPFGYFPYQDGLWQSAVDTSGLSSFQSMSVCFLLLS